MSFTSKKLLLSTKQQSTQSGSLGWTAATMPSVANWRSVAYGEGRFVAISITRDDLLLLALVQI